MSSEFFVKLPGRGAVIVGGGDRRDFLQALITQDITLLDAQPCAYGCLLNPQGQILHDFFMTHQGDAIRLECEGGERARDLLTRLSRYKLRANVTLEAFDNVDVYAGCGSPPPGSFADPRLAALGWRSYTAPAGGPAAFAVYDRHRIAHGVPDGSRDMGVGESTILECNLDRLNAVSFGKGCYIGQEVTARMHYRNAGKTHLRVVQGAALPAPGTDLSVDGHRIGTMKSSCGEVGLASLRDDADQSLRALGLTLAQGQI